MALLAATSQRPTQAEAPKEVGTALESLLLKQLISSSGAFKGTSAPGSQITPEPLRRARWPTPWPSRGARARRTRRTRALRSMQTATPARPRRTYISLHHRKGLHGRGQRTDNPGNPDRPLGPCQQPLRNPGRPHQRHRPQPSGHLDIAATAGSPILAAGDGIVVAAGARGGYGQAVEIQHGSGVTTLYGHASQVLVHPGQHVTQGQPIATVGQTRTMRPGPTSTSRYVRADTHSTRHAPLAFIASVPMYPPRPLTTNRGPI